MSRSLRDEDLKQLYILVKAFNEFLLNNNTLNKATELTDRTIEHPIELNPKANKEVDKLFSLAQASSRATSDLTNAYL